MNKSQKLLSIALSAAMALSSASLASVNASAEWVKSGDGCSYKDDGTGEKLTGWQTIGGETYYFDKNGCTLTGWKIINGDTYFFNGSKKGKMLTGWARIGGKQYYFGSDGVMRKGWIKIKGSTYYFASDGVMLTGTYRISGKVYTFGSDGRLTYTSAALGCTVGTVTKGVVFGSSSMEEVYDMLPFEDKEMSEEDGMIAFIPAEECIGMYLFNEDGTAGGVMLMYDGIGSMEEAEPFFTEAGWKYEESHRLDDSVIELYMSPDGSAFGYIVAENGMALITVASCDDIDGLYYDVLEDY
ncbi:MAG: hypothetical protein NC078_12890 [Ruminococcus sp.]|nr:hypothetical protein [Ruminococcus sp.]